MYLGAAGASPYYRLTEIHPSQLVSSALQRIISCSVLNKYNYVKVLAVAKYCIVQLDDFLISNSKKLLKATVR